MRPKRYSHLVSVTDWKYAQYSIGRGDVGIETACVNYKICKPLFDFYRMEVIPEHEAYEDFMAVSFRVSCKITYSLSYSKRGINFSSFVYPYLPVHEIAHRAYALRYDPMSTDKLNYNSPSSSTETEIHVLTLMFLRRLGYNIRMFFKYLGGKGGLEGFFLIQERLLSVPFTSRFLDMNLKFI